MYTGKHEMLCNMVAIASDSGLADFPPLFMLLNRANMRYFRKAAYIQNATKH
jgi:hypothetical protein